MQTLTHIFSLMKNIDLAARVSELNNLIHEMRFEEALNEFYDEATISVENEDQTTIGLEFYRESARRYLGSVTNYSANLLNVIVSDNITVTEWHYQFDHAEWGHWDMRQISVQRWRHGKIVHERHHYDKPNS